MKIGFMGGSRAQQPSVDESATRRHPSHGRSARRNHGVDSYESATTSRIREILEQRRPRIDTDPDLSHPPPGSGISARVWEHLPLEDRRAIWGTEPEGSAGAPEQPTAVDLSHPPPGSGFSTRVWEHLPLEDRRAVWGLEPEVAEPLPEPLNPELAAFLEDHPEIQTNQDFIEFFYAGKGNDLTGWAALAAGCGELGVEINDIVNHRSAPIRDLAYPPPAPDGSLPTSAEEAQGFHLVQFADPIYNPTGPTGSNNCGPASLAMVLQTQGLMPPGLTPEQRIDHARALMYGTHNDEIVVRGQTVPLLDRDGELTTTTAIETGGEALGLAGEQMEGWVALDRTLATGQPVVAYGDCYGAWKEQFAEIDGRYGAGEVEHFIAILGRTEEGNYIVSDPMFTGGPVEMTRDQLAVFFDKHVGSGEPSEPPRFVAFEGNAGEES